MISIAKFQILMLVIAILFSCSNPTKDRFKTSIKFLVEKGQRPDFSHDGKKILYITKAGGEVEEMNIESGEKRRISAFKRPDSVGFFRALYLANGDYLLTGGKDRRGCVFYFLKKELNQPPFIINEPIWEGPAVSRKNMHIAWTPNHVTIWSGDIVCNDSGYAIVNRKLILESDKIFADGQQFNDWIEPQNFRPPLEYELIFSQYGREEIFTSEVFGINLQNGKITNYTKAPKQYDEPEGIFPNGEYTLIESDEHNPKGTPFLDVYMVKLDGSGKNRQRLTFFNTRERQIASNPVISDDGKFMAFDTGAGLTDTDEGMKIGIYLMDLQKAGIVTK